jgi:uracil-DNA glycosylase family 4
MTQSYIDLSAYVNTTASKIPNVFPTTVSAPYRIAIIGEAPGKNEEDEGKPFVGAAGKFLTALLIDSNIDRKECFIGNVCQIRPPNNKVELFKWSGPEIQSGLEQLRTDIAVVPT